ncbi:MAG: hypothetical protein ACT6QS_11605 [Flavobacteriales bacterium]
MQNLKHLLLFISILTFYEQFFAYSIVYYINSKTESGLMAIMTRLV